MLFSRPMGGEGKFPLIILHGILGSSRNWGVAGPKLADFFQVHAIDLPSHGSSPSLQEMTFQSMADEVITWMDSNCFEKVYLLGHSLGGKVAMVLASIYPERIERLIVADIIPREYPPHSFAAIEAMLALDLTTIKSRREAEVLLEPVAPDLGLRKFLLTNLVRSEDQQFFWQTDLLSLRNSLQSLAQNPMENRLPYTGGTQFLLGEYSEFVRDGDEDLIRHYFPVANIQIIQNAGHNLHFDNLPDFVDAVAVLV